MRGEGGPGPDSLQLCADLNLQAGGDSLGKQFGVNERHVLGLAEKVPAKLACEKGGERKEMGFSRCFDFALARPQTSRSTPMRGDVCVWTELC